MTILNDHYEYTIAGHYLTAIVNGDYSGLSDEEENDLNRFLSEANNLDNATWDLPEDEPHFAICEICGLHADCYTVKLYFNNPTISE
jgi:hypothetical protein